MCDFIVSADSRLKLIRYVHVTDPSANEQASKLFSSVCINGKYAQRKDFPLYLLFVYIFCHNYFGQSCSMALHTMVSTFALHADFTASQLELRTGRILQNIVKKRNTPVFILDALWRKRC